MTPEQKAVKKWMTDFGQATPDKPTIPSLEVRQLRAKLILEEALETIKALGFKVCGNITDDNLWVMEAFEPNLTEIADGLADLHVVAYCGTGAACGLDMEPIMREVLRSNDSKKWMLSDVGNGCCLVPKECTCELVSTGKWVVKDASGKIIKPKGYSAANLAPIIEAQKGEK